MSSPRPQVMRPEDVCTVCLKLLEMLPSKRLHNAFQMAHVKMFYRRSERVCKIENPPSSKRFYFNFKSKDLKSSTKCLQDLSIERLQNVFMVPSNY